MPEKKPFPKPNTIEWYEEMAYIENSMGHINTATEFLAKAKVLRDKQK